MVTDFTVLSTRRVYEYPQDSIRLTALTTIEAQRALRDAFAFQDVGSGTVAGAFETALVTQPSGLTCSFGRMLTDEDEIIPVRYLTLNARRLMIDVAAASDAIDMIYHRAVEILGGISVPGGIKTIGQPVATRDYSEVTARVSFSADELLAGPFLDWLRHTGGGLDLSAVSAIVPTIQWQLADPNEEYQGLATPFAVAAVRAGTRVGDRVLFSAAYLDSSAHLSHLQSLETSLDVQR